MMSTQSFMFGSQFNLDSLHEDLSQIESMEQFIAEGNMGDLLTFFGRWDKIPARLGEWELRKNEQIVQGAVKNRTVVAIPLTVRARSVFEQGCIQTLLQKGFSMDEAAMYYKSAWKRKYVWVDGVLSVVKELIDSYNTTAPLEQCESAGDPRRLASQMGVPSNPYAVSHNHFLTAIQMARCIIKGRNRFNKKAIKLSQKELF